MGIEGDAAASKAATGVHARSAFRPGRAGSNREVQPEMTKVLLVNPDFKETRADDSIFPFGYAAMGAVLQKHGHEVDYIFPGAHRISFDEGVELAASTDADLVGIGGLFPYLPVIKKFIAALKERRPDLPIIAGGPMITHAPKFGFEESGADLGCNGEGEVLLWKLADAMCDGWDYHAIPGLVFRRDDGEVVINGTGELMAFEDIPMPTWDDFPVDYYLYTDWFIPEYVKTERKRTFAWHLSRGCPSKCNFCVSGCATRQKSIELCMDRTRGDRPEVPAGSDDLRGRLPAQQTLVHRQVLRSADRARLRLRVLGDEQVPYGLAEDIGPAQEAPVAR